MANIKIDSALIQPSTVYTGAQAVISIGIADIVYAILDTDGSFLMTKSGESIERIPREDDVYAILDKSGEYYLTTKDGYAIEQIPGRED